MELEGELIEGVGSEMSVIVALRTAGSRLYMQKL